MLAKWWKKVLLAICILACIVNIMLKLINRTSLESNLQAANDGNTILDSLRTDEEDLSNGEVQDDEVSDNSSYENVVSETDDETMEELDEIINTEEDGEIVNEEDNEAINEEDSETIDGESDTEEDSSSSKTVKYSDFVVIY